MPLSEISEATDAPASIDQILVLISKLESAQAAEDDARRAHGAACRALALGDKSVDTKDTADRLRAAVEHREGLSVALAGIDLSGMERAVEEKVASERPQWDLVSALLDRRAEAVAELQRAADAFATTLVDVHAVTGEVWAALPRRPSYVGPNWSGMARAAAVYVYGASGGVFGVHGVIDSPFTIRTARPDLCAIAAGDREIIEGMRR